MLFQSIVVYYDLIPNRLDYAINVFNEIATSVYLYLMMALTDFIGENPLRNNIGWALLALVMIVVIINAIKACINCYPIIKRALISLIAKVRRLV